MRTFRSLRHRNYRLYFIGQMISLIGSWMQSTVLMWLAFEWTHESRWASFLMVAQLGPTFLLGFWAGALADRYPKHKLIIRTQTCFLITASVLTLMLYLKIQSITLLIILMGLQGIVQAIDLPARLSFVPDLVAKEDLINAVSLNSVLFNVARAIGPAIAGIFLQWNLSELCILLNAISYLAVLAALLAMTPVVEHHHHQEGLDPRNGFAILASQPRMLLLVLLAGCVAGFGWPLLPLLPAYSEQVLLSGKAGYSRLLSSLGIGALTAALITATFGNEERKSRFIFVGLVCASIALACLTQIRELYLGTIACGCFGFGMILFFSTGQATVQISTHRANRGKVMGVWAMMLSGGVPMGNLVIGPAADHFGTVHVLSIQAIILSTMTGLLLFFGRRSQ